MKNESTDTKPADTKAEEAPGAIYGRFTFALTAEVQYEELKIKELVLDFGAMNCDEIIEIHQAAVRDNGGNPIPYPALDPFVQKRAAAKAAGVQPGMIGKLGVQDAMEVLGTTRDFLLSLRSSSAPTRPEQPETGSRAP